MKVLIELMSRDLQGHEHKITIDGTVAIANLTDIKLLWEAERTINERATIRCHINLRED